MRCGGRGGWWLFRGERKGGSVAEQTTEDDEASSLCANDPRRSLGEVPALCATTKSWVVLARGRKRYVWEHRLGGTLSGCDAFSARMCLAAFDAKHRLNAHAKVPCWMTRSNSLLFTLHQGCSSIFPDRSLPMGYGGVSVSGKKRGARCKQKETLAQWSAGHGTHEMNA